MWNPHILLALPALLWATTPAYALGQASCVSFTKPSGASFAIAASTGAAPIFFGADDWPGVRRAAADFAADIKAVTGRAPALANLTAAAAGASAAAGRAPVFVGTLGKSALIDAIVAHANVDVSAVEGKWEAWSAQVVKNPLPGVQEAYVIIGADKRGTIYALYDHSEQFGALPPSVCVVL